MKKLMLLSLLLMIGVGSFAQATRSYRVKSATAEDTDPRSTEILSKVNKVYASYKSMQMDLTLTIQDGDYKEVQKGNVMVKGNKFKIDSKDQKIISDGRTNWLYLKQQKELQISNPDPDDIALFSSPDKLLKQYEKDFIAAFAGEETISGVAYFQIEFKPKDRNSEYSKVRVTVDKSAYTIKQIKVFDKSNIHYTIEIDKLIKNPSLSDDEFKFDVSNVPQNNIIDLRS